MDRTTDPRRARGDLGERLAADYLVRKGYRIHETNFRCRLGELDIIASDRGTLVFVEVRTRLGTSFGTPEESVTSRKQRKVHQVAEAYLQTRYPGAAINDKRNKSAQFAPPPIATQRPGEWPPCRIDVVVVALAHNGTVERIELIRDAIRE